MKQKLMNGVMLLLVISLFMACAATDYGQTKQADILEIRDEAENTSEKTENINQSLSSKESEKILPLDIPKLFGFYSGASGWSTYLKLYEDGTFQGFYFAGMLDSIYDMPDISYTWWFSDFNGGFSIIEKTDDSIYRLELSELNYAEPEREYVKDNMMYITAEPYGLEKGKEFILYCPGTPITSLPENYVMWNLNRVNEADTNLSLYALSNVEMGYFFFEEEDGNVIEELRNDIGIDVDEYERIIKE